MLSHFEKIKKRSCLHQLILVGGLLANTVGFAEKSDNSRPAVDDKYKLSQDRAEFDKLRSQIPEEKKKENDELAVMAGWMAEMRYSPSEVREKFHSAMRKKREAFEKEMKLNREQFSKLEKDERTGFMKDMESERKSFMRRKTNPDQKKEFYQEIEGKRKDFFASQREKREAFEADLRDRRKNFDDYVREKNSEFNSEMRAYQKRYDDIKKQKKEAANLNSTSEGGEKERFKSETQVQHQQKVISPQDKGITAEDLDRAFEQAKDKPKKKLEAGQ